MNTLAHPRLGAIALLFCAHITSALAVTFSHDVFISFADPSYDGEDIVVTNCVLTVDGTHAFNSLQLLNGAVLTHSPFPYGPQQFTFAASGESHVLSDTTPAVLANTNIENSSIVVMDWTGTSVYTENVDYFITSSNQFTVLNLTTNSSITNGATVLVGYEWDEAFQGFNLSISNGVTITQGGAINVSGKGYAGGIGFLNGAGASQSTNYPFVFSAGGGGGHGGSGGMSSSSARGGATYDSTIQPGALGSGGGFGTSAGGGGGGGVAMLSLGGDLQLDGQIMADGLRGTNAHCGGGAGGSIFISAQNFSGTGTLSARGGAGDSPDGGGGGGGRVAVYFTTNSFTGNMIAFGGTGATVGGAGTIYLQSATNSSGQLFIVNGGKRGTNTTFSASVSDLTIAGGAITQPIGTSLSLINLFVGSNSWLTPADSLALSLTISGNATVESNAAIIALPKSVSGGGVGTANCGAGSGGGYGGFGGASVCGAAGGNIFGTLTQPSNPGSPGGGSFSGRGGGLISMTVSGTLSLAGNISADGGSPGSPTSGGGSGGGIYLRIGTFQGAGTISANGGPANNLSGGGGGGGRVAVYFSTNLFTGNILAHGSLGTNSGGPGTIYLKSINDPFAQLILDNGGLTGLSSLSSLSDITDLQISGGAFVTNNTTTLPVVLAKSLFIGSNSWLVAPIRPTGSGSGSPIAIVTTNITIQAGGGLYADGVFTLIGAGTGQTFAGAGGGGGNGGNGGASATNGSGGVAFASTTTPASNGGIGGNGSGPGGYGGGVIGLTAEKLQLDGTLTANGTRGSLNSGGGAGGSISISARTFSGAGIISANGGAGNTFGGGGGGGAIAIVTDTNTFSGPITAFGGAGANYGGAGTLYFSRRSQSADILPQVIVDNRGIRGAMTPINKIQTTLNLTVTNGGAVSNSLSQFGNLTIGSNSVFQTFLNSGSQQISVLTNVTIFAGGSLNVDGISASSLGQGQTFNSTGGGGSYAGTGGNSISNALGGTPPSDSFSSPALGGGRGGGGFSQAAGGNGGGNLHLSVVGALRIDGKMSADGANGIFLNSGGGAGGGLSISTRTLLGNGAISANGGAGNGVGGGGGGGRIAISYFSNFFTGNVVAHGGAGANNGGAGTIYITSSPQSPSGGLGPQLILDNGGLLGNTTPVTSSLGLNPSITVTGGATLATAIPWNVPNLFIGSNSMWLSGSSSQVSLNVTSNVVIQASGKLSADGVISGGPGQGGVGINSVCGGGGHAGYGGAGISNAPGGNVTLDSVTQPSGTGSRGGPFGGLGGGALLLSIRGNLQLDGQVTVNGLDSPAPSGGGGSGGSIFLTVGKIAGSGTFSANGGAGSNGGGGGGGGRIAVRLTTNQFSGNFTARGGAGANYGGAGTICIIPNTDKAAQLIVDNGGVRGTNTLISSDGNGSDVTIASGASVALANTQPSWNSLLISSNASLGFSPQTTAQNITVTGNFTIQPGGVILLDGQGFAANEGTGYGMNGGGAGHGGYGSSGEAANQPGGIAYDSIVSPTLAGSGGGTGAFTNGSTGGAALHLVVNGILTNNGVISAKGQSATVLGAGGGSGGSLWFTLGTLAGNGKISVDGGDGEFFGGGGGGAGGRISATFTSNRFTGTFSAVGGFGPIVSGGAGTIYLKTNNFPGGLAQLLLDNGGDVGTNTPIDTALPFFSVSVRNGAVASSMASPMIQNLSIESGGLLKAWPTNALNLTVLNNVVVDAGGAISAEAAGWDNGNGTGAGEVDFSGSGSGGGYGGAGGVSWYGEPGGITYGSSNQPTSFGSPGGISPTLAGFSQGGGAIHLTVSGRLTVNGKISANGNDGVIDGAGGGSGGSIWVTAQAFTGNGSLTANGGAGESDEGGGGGGGRIAVYGGTNNSFLGNISVAGGSGAATGQNGTIYISGTFSVSGTVLNADGTALAGITLQPSGLSSVVSDANGGYHINVPPFWTGSIVPTDNDILLPASRSYSGLSSNVMNQDFLAVSPTALNFSSGQFDGTNINLNWYGFNGITYQVQCSTNLVDWIPYGPVFVGTNGPAAFAIPPTNAPQMYFRLGVSY